jgi:hypothetical protein
MDSRFLKITDNVKGFLKLAKWSAKCPRHQCRGQVQNDHNTNTKSRISENQCCAFVFYQFNFHTDFK